MNREATEVLVKGDTVEISHGLRRYDDSQGGTYHPDWKLEVTFERPDPTDPGSITAVNLSSQAQGKALGARTLGRFGWAQWLRVAEVAIRNPGPQPPMTLGAGDIIQQMQAWDAAHAQAQAPLRASIRKAIKSSPRPGRRGRSDGFYQQIAELHQAHLRAGHPDPTRRIIEDLGGKVSRNTVSGWLKKARDLERENQRVTP